MEKSMQIQMHMPMHMRIDPMFGVTGSVLGDIKRNVRSEAGA